MANTNEKEILDKEAFLPTDVHLVRWAKKSWKKKSAISAVRAYKMVDIFDQFHDQGYVVLEIVQGYGRIKPKLYTPEHEANL